MLDNIVLNVHIRKVMLINITVFTNIMSIVDTVNLNIYPFMCVVYRKTVHFPINVPNSRLTHAYT